MQRLYLEAVLSSDVFLLLWIITRTVLLADLVLIRTMEVFTYAIEAAKALGLISYMCD